MNCKRLPLNGLPHTRLTGVLRFQWRPSNIPSKAYCRFSGIETGEFWPLRTTLLSLKHFYRRKLPRHEAPKFPRIPVLLYLQPPRDITHCSPKEDAPRSCNV